MDYLTDIDFFSDNQYGFRRNHSTVLPLLFATHNWHSSLNSNKSVACIFFDLKKAFDSIPHQALLNKLHLIQVPDVLLKCLTNYLFDRGQRVVFNGCSSELLPVISGVPQGSILGPLLFLIYMNDLCSLTLSRGAKLNMFADDALLYKEVSTIEDFQSVQYDVNSISECVNDNSLSFNTAKTKCMLITRKRKRPFSSFSLYLNGLTIERVSSYKYLGFWISDDLSWSKHVNHVCTKARRLIGYLYRIFAKNLSPELFVTLYKSQVLPILEYACVVWDPHLKSDINSIENVQLFELRVATQSWKSSSSLLNSAFNVPTLSNRRVYFKLVMTYKLLNGLTYCLSGVFLYRTNPNLRVSHNKQLIPAFTRTNSIYYSFFYSTVRTWNSLSSVVVNSNTINSYKNHLKLIYIY